jgi:hypothetical protein
MKDATFYYIKILIFLNIIKQVVGGALEEPKAAEVSRCILEIG